MPIHNDTGDGRPKLQVRTNYGGQMLDPESWEARKADYERNNGSTKNLRPTLKPLTDVNEGRAGSGRPVVFHEDGTYTLPRGTTEWDFPHLFPDHTDKDFEPKTPQPRKRATRKKTSTKTDKGLDDAIDKDLSKRNIKNRKPTQ